MKRLAVIVAMLLLAVPLAGSARADDGDASSRYQATQATQCELTASSTVVRGKPSTLRIVVRGNTASDVRARGPRGKVSLAVSKAGGSRVLTKTTSYPGRPISVRIPALRDLGRYRVASSFTANDGTVYRGCSCSTSFRVTKRDQTGPGVQPIDTTPNGGPGTGATDGVLPNTGGPDLGWLLLGLGLVLSGLACVAAGVRRRAVALRA